MDPYANMGCVLKVNTSFEACSRRKALDVLSFICGGTHNISIDAYTGLVHIRQRVDINFVLHSLAKSGQYAKLVHVRVPLDPYAHRFDFVNPLLPLRNGIAHCQHDGRFGFAHHHRGHGRNRVAHVHHHHHHHHRW